MTPLKAEELFERVEGGMQPSKSSLDRLPKLVSERWESERGTRCTNPVLPDVVA